MQQIQDLLLRDVVRTPCMCAFTLGTKKFRSKPKLRLIIKRLCQYLRRERLNSKQNVEYVHLVTDLANRLIMLHNKYSSDCFRSYGVNIGRD